MKSLAGAIDKIISDAPYTDLPRLVLSSMAAVHGIIVIIFGVGLIASVDRVNGPIYSYLQLVNGWPASVGTFYIICGVLVLVARFRKTERTVLSLIVFTLLAFASLAYGTLFLAGSADSQSILGPQVNYLGFSTLYFLHAIFSLSEWLKERRRGEDDIISLVRDGD